MSSVLVTGASRGIGLATCIALAETWHTLVASDFGLHARA